METCTNTPVKPVDKLLPSENQVKTPLWFIVINAISFQSIWFIAVARGNAGSLALVLPIVLLHFILMDRVYRKRFSWLNELKLISLCVGIGFIVEAVKLQLDVWAPSVVDVVPPLWLMTLWVGLAMSLHVSFGFFESRLLLAFVVGACSAPLSYFAGSRLSPTFELADPYFSLPVIAGIWSIVFPLLLIIARSLPAQIVPMQLSETSTL